MIVKSISASPIVPTKYELDLWKSSGPLFVNN